MPTCGSWFGAGWWCEGLHALCAHGASVGGVLGKRKVKWEGSRWTVATYLQGTGEVAIVGEA